MYKLLTISWVIVCKIISKAARETEMEKTERKLREDLSPQERERFERFGSLRFRSVEEVLPAKRQTVKFIPSREQH